MVDPLEEFAIRRILLALDASARGMAAIRAATELAANVQAELLGLFVEGINLLRLAGLPFAREVDYASAAGRSLAFPDIERAFRAQAALAERSLAMAAEQVQVQWSFRVTRGHVLAEVLAKAVRAQKGEALVLASVEPAWGEEGIGALLDAIECPIMLVR